jgi:hypothetical protein
MKAREKVKKFVVGIVHSGTTFCDTKALSDG